MAAFRLTKVGEDVVVVVKPADLAEMGLQVGGLVELRPIHAAAAESAEDRQRRISDELLEEYAETYRILAQ